MVLCYTDNVGVLMGTDSAPLVADLFLFCYEAFNSTSRYLDDLSNIDNRYFEGMVNQIYPHELRWNKTNASDTEAPFLNLHISVYNGFVSQA